MQWSLTGLSHVVTGLRVAGAPEGCRFAAAGPNNVRKLRDARPYGLSDVVCLTLSDPRPHSKQIKTNRTVE